MQQVKRTQAVRCPVCGRPASSWAEGSVNISFDMEKFEQGAGKP